MIAALPMYDPPYVQPANDQLWQFWSHALREGGIASPPSRLHRQMSAPDIATDPQLLVSQTCGLEYALDPDAYALVATPCYDVPGCEGANYRSVIIARANDPRESLVDFRGATVGLTSWYSHSSYTALVATLIEMHESLPFFGHVHMTGRHLGSMAAVAEGEADCAAVDCVTWAHALAEEQSAVAKLRVIGMTPAAPGLPLVTPRSSDDRTVGLLRETFAELLENPKLRATRTALFLHGAKVLQDEDYAPLAELWRYAQERNFRESAVTLQ